MVRNQKRARTLSKDHSTSLNGLLDISCFVSINVVTAVVIVSRIV